MLYILNLAGDSEDNCHVLYLLSPGKFKFTTWKYRKTRIIEK